MSELTRRGVLRSAAGGLLATSAGAAAAAAQDPVPPAADAQGVTVSPVKALPEGEANELVILGVGQPGSNPNEIKTKIEQTAIELKAERTGANARSLRDRVIATPTRLTRPQYEAYDDMLKNRPTPSVSGREGAGATLVPFERATSNVWLLDLGGTYKLQQVKVVTVDEKGGPQPETTFTPDGADGTKLARYLDAPGEYELEIEKGRRVKSFKGVKYDSLKRTNEGFEGENRRENSFWYIHVKGVEPGEVKGLFDLLSDPERPNPIQGLKRTVSKVFVQAALDTIPELGTTTVVGNQVSVRVNRLSQRKLKPVFEESVLLIFPLTSEAAKGLAREANELNDATALAARFTNRVEVNDKDFRLRPGAEPRVIVLPPSSDAFAFERVLTVEDAPGWRARAATEFWRVVLLVAKNKQTGDQTVIRVVNPGAAGTTTASEAVLAVAEPDTGWLVGMTTDPAPNGGVINAGGGTATKP